MHIWQIQMLFTHSDRKKTVLGKEEALSSSTFFCSDGLLQICMALEHRNYIAEHGHILSERGTKLINSINKIFQSEFSCIHCEREMNTWKQTLKLHT